MTVASLIYRMKP